MLLARPYLQAQLIALNHDTTMGAGSLAYDTLSGTLYVGTGYSTWGGFQTNHIASWSGTDWVSVGDGFQYGTAYQLECFHGNLFAGGNMENWTNGADIHHLGRWDGAQWNSCGEPNSWPFMFPINDQLWAGGIFDSIGTQAISGIARWNGSSWDGFGGGIPNNDIDYNRVECGGYYQGHYYFGGNFTPPDFIAEDIVMRDGNNWASVGGGVAGAADAWLTGMQVYQNKLFVCGTFWSMGNPSRNIMMWNGTSWEGFFPNLVFCMSGICNDMRLIDGKLYFAGAFIFTGDNKAYNLLIYDGETLCGVGSSGLGLDMKQAYQVVGDAQSIYFNTDARMLSGDTVNYIAKWVVANGPDTCIAIPVGMRELDAGRPLCVYPNPARDVITVQLPCGERNAGVSVVIRDALGQEVLRATVREYPRGEVVVDVHALPKGSYFGRVMGSSSQAFRFLKQ